MKKVTYLAILLMAVVNCVDARVCGRTGCYSNSQRGGYNHDRTCRVIEGHSYCDDYSGIYFQISPGIAIMPDMGFAGSFAFGKKFSSGMTLGLRLNGKYTARPTVSVGMTITYEFTALRKYTDIFYPVLGADFGFGGMQVDKANHWDALPYAGYRAGFRFAVVRQRFDIGLEYNSNYNFAIKSLADHSKSFWDHSAVLTLCVYVP